MATVTILPEFVHAVRGTLSKNSKYYFRTINGQVHMYAKPQYPHRHQCTGQQLNQRNRFAQAQAAACVIYHNARLAKWAEQKWHQLDNRHRYTTLRGWLIAELMKG